MPSLGLTSLGDCVSFVGFSWNPRWLQAQDNDVSVPLVSEGIEIGEAYRHSLSVQCLRAGPSRLLSRSEGDRHARCVERPG